MKEKRKKNGMWCCLLGSAQESFVGRAALPQFRAILIYPWCPEAILRIYVYAGLCNTRILTAYFQIISPFLPSASCMHHDSSCSKAWREQYHYYMWLWCDWDHNCAIVVSNEAFRLWHASLAVILSYLFFLFVFFLGWIAMDKFSVCVVINEPYSLRKNVQESPIICWRASRVLRY